MRIGFASSRADMNPARSSTCTSADSVWEGGSVRPKARASAKITSYRSSSSSATAVQHSPSSEQPWARTMGGLSPTVSQ